MANHSPQYSPAGESLSPSMHATSSRVPMSGVKRARSPDGEDRPRQRPRHESAMINNLGISGNSRVVNVLGDQITHNNDGLGPETHAALESIEQRLKVVHDEKLDKKVGGWLSAPDVSQNLNAALRRRQAGTGGWFLDGAQFQEWKETPNVTLCIYGAPGCGKTVLCSTIIEAVQDLCKTRLTGWAYFFFDSRNANKGLQLYENFLRAILSQLCSRCGGIPEVVKTMHEAHGSGKEQPSVKALEDILRQVIEAFDDVYIMVDSLDECGDRSELLKWIETLAGGNSARWHLLTTSRSEPDIASHLERIRNIHIVHLKGTALDKDIRIFLHGRLSLISHWSEPIRALIMTTLIEGADGMFRWVAMQIDSLQHCLKVKEIKAKLKVLPKDLAETYERILASSVHQDDLLQMLHWLAFSARALRVEELAEVLSVDFDAEAGPSHDPDLRYAHPRSALAICSGLVTVTDGTVKLAHFSVKEYLLSDRIKTGTAARFSINERLSQLVIAQTCVAYLLIFNKPNSFQTPVEPAGPFPLHLYAAEYTDRHLHYVGNSPCPALQRLLLDLFLPAPHFESALVNWGRIYNPDYSWLGVHSLRSADEVAPPIYYASSLGLHDVVKRLLQHGADVTILRGGLGNALRAAAENGHTEIATLLLEHGADTNIMWGRSVTALHAAVTNGRTEIVKILLEHGADPNIEGGGYGTTLQKAAAGGHTDIVKILLEHGADPNIKGGGYGTALQEATASGHKDIVKILLEHGADPNIEGGGYGTTLQKAAASGHTDIVKILLEHGAEPNIKGRRYRTALQEATASGHPDIVDVLLKRGADPNNEGGRYGTALQEAAASGHTAIVKILLEHGAVPGIKGGGYGTALQAAAASGHTDIVKILLEHGAEPNIEGGGYGTALQASAASGHTDIVKILLERGADYRREFLAAAASGNTNIVKILLEHGADPNIEGGGHGTALQAAAAGGHTDIVKILLEHSANPNIKAGLYGTALQRAAARRHTEVVDLLLQHGVDYKSELQGAAASGHTDIVDVLLEHGADPNIEGGEYGTALQAAAGGGHTDIVKILLEHSADPNIKVGLYGTALQRAAARRHTEIVDLLLQRGVDYRSELQGAAASGHTDIVKILLEHGADPNIKGGRYGTALQAAAARGHQQLAKVLLESGADANIQGGHYGTALQAAAARGHQQLVKVFLESGADSNIQGGDYGTALQAAAYSGDTEITKLLLEAGADINILGRPPFKSWVHDTTALEVAAARGHTDTLQLLL